MKFAGHLRRVSPIALAALLLTCGGSNPTGSTPPTTTPTTRPSATPTPPPATTLCTRLGYVNPAASRCSEEAPVFLADVDAAIHQVMHEHPDYFQNGPNGILIRNFGGFYVGVINALDAMNTCAGFDGEEIQVKSTNDFNEQYKISTSSGYVRQDNQYRATCHPAAFPTPPPANTPPPPGCTLPPSQSIACGVADPHFSGDITASIDQVVAQHPELFDQSDAAGPGGYKVLDPVAFVNDVIDAMTQRGYCGHFDGDEVAIKRTNDFSEHYDILTGDNHIRRGSGEYRASCDPAAF